VPLAVCATPIGNLDDVTLRVLAELREADLVLCEDTRRTRILLDRHEIEARLQSYHRHNEATRTEEVLARLERGERVALVSDAGLPGVNDPGARLIRAALAAGVAVTVLPGPSAVETSLVASGLVGDRYQFVGYLPRRTGELRAAAAEWARWPHTVVAFESPRRLPTSLGVLAEEMPDRPAAVCRELTKRFEETVRGTLRELAARFTEPPKGEITLVLGAPGAGAGVAGVAHVAEDDAVTVVGELVAAGVARRQAADVVARLTGISRNSLYRASL
jgi:16S rRNA (cytidine1402-2'-O)-methyltransferase